MFMNLKKYFLVPKYLGNINFREIIRLTVIYMLQKVLNIYRPFQIMRSQSDFVL